MLGALNMASKPSARAVTLAKLALTQGWTKGAELGVYEGATTDHLLSTCPLLQMVGVDVWLPIEGGPKDKTTGFSPKAAGVIAEACAKAYQVRERHGADRFWIKRERTVDAALDFNPATFDFVFVDASHVTADVVADILAWRPLVKPGGMILGHDADWPAIQEALRQVGFLDRAEYYDGNVWGVRL